jgi:NAD+ kinase
MAERKVLLITHPNREETWQAAEELVSSLGTTIQYFSTAPRAMPGVVSVDPSALPPGIELAVVFGGDGTILRAAEIVHSHGIPILGVNLGHVGFLAQLDRPSIGRLASLIQDKTFTTEERLMVSYEIIREQKVSATGFASRRCQQQVSL